MRSSGRREAFRLKKLFFHLGEVICGQIESHYNQEVYPSQQIFFIPVGDYVYLVPFVESDGTYFLKNAFPQPKSDKRIQKGVRISYEIRCRRN